MLPLNVLLQHSLFYGAILSVLMTALILGTLYWRPLMWSSDAPPDVRAAAPPMTDADRRAKKIGGVATLLLLAGVFGAAVVALRRLGGGAPSFGDVALSTFLIFMVFNLVDLLLIDWLLVVRLRPNFVVLPGTAHLAGYDDYGFHFRAFLKGTAGGVLLALMVAAVAILIF